MDIKLKEFKVGEHISYKIEDKNLCCEKIKDCEIIDLSQDYNLSPQVSITKAKYTYSDGDYWDDTSFIPIEFCPFCGERVSLEIIFTEDATDYWDSVAEQENNVRARARCTDSKAEEQSLLSEASGYSDDLNWFLTNGSLHEDVE